MQDTLNLIQMALLSVVFDLGADKAYGLAIYDTMCRECEVKIAYGSLYPTLNRLEDEGLISSRLEADPQRGGRPRRYFQLEAAGMRAFNSSQLAYQKLWRTPITSPAG